MLSEQVPKQSSLFTKGDYQESAFLDFQSMEPQIGQHGAEHFLCNKVESPVNRRPPFIPKL
jgi:hypothetical protein